MGKSPYYVQKLFAQAANFDVDELRDATVRLAELDLALKGGSRLAGDLELEQALVEITRRVEPAAAAVAG
jgi:DNA polymerase III delta subunit